MQRVCQSWKKKTERGDAWHHLSDCDDWEIREAYKGKKQLSGQPMKGKECWISNSWAKDSSSSSVQWGSQGWKNKTERGDA